MATRLNVVPPNLPIATKQYEQRYQEQLNNVQRLFYNSVANQINAPYPFGSYFTSLDLTAGKFTNPTANVQHLVPFVNITEQFNTSVGAVPNNSRIYVSETGVYNVQFSAQCDLGTGGGSTATFYFWLRKNGVEVAATTGKVVINGSSAATIPAWNYLLSLQANDYIELAWSSDNIKAFLAVVDSTSITAGGSTYTRPAIPAVILTIMWASSSNNSVGIS
jgi:hypothetical protein